jgi:hypothetical protein
MGKFLDKEGLKNPFSRQFCKRFDQHLRASSGFQAFFAEIPAGQILQRSRGTSLQRHYLSAIYEVIDPTTRNPISTLRNTPIVPR